MDDITQDAIARIFGMNENFNYMLMEETGLGLYLFYAIISFTVIFIVFKILAFAFSHIGGIESIKSRYISSSILIFMAALSLFLFNSKMNDYNADLKEHLNSVRREDNDIFIYNQFLRDEIKISKEDIKSIKIRLLEHVHKRSTLNLIMGSNEKVSLHCEILIETNTGKYELNSFPENMYLLRLPSCK